MAEAGDRAGIVESGVFRGFEAEAGQSASRTGLSPASCSREGMPLSRSEYRTSLYTTDCLTCIRYSRIFSALRYRADSE